MVQPSQFEKSHEDAKLLTKLAVSVFRNLDRMYLSSKPIKQFFRVEIKKSVKFGKSNLFRKSSTVLATPNCPAACELWRWKTTLRKIVFGTQYCFYFTLPQSS